MDFHKEQNNKCELETIQVIWLNQLLENFGEKKRNYYYYYYY